MSVKDCVGREINEGDFVAYVTAGDRHPVFEFGYVLGFHQANTGHNPPMKIKLQRADSDGTRRNKMAIDVPGHWREDTPDEIEHPKYGQGHTRTREDFDKYYVSQTFRDTGKPNTTMLEVSSNDNSNGRLLLTSPYV